MRAKTNSNKADKHTQVRDIQQQALDRAMYELR